MAQCPRSHLFSESVMPFVVACQRPAGHPGLHRWETVIEWRDPRDEGENVRA